jgi:hypothetical protein
MLNMVDDVVNHTDGIVEFNAVNPLQVKAPVTFNGLWHVIVCNIVFKATVVCPDSFATNAKSYDGEVKTQQYYLMIIRWVSGQCIIIIHF